MSRHTHVVAIICRFCDWTVLTRVKHINRFYPIIHRVMPYHAIYWLFLLCFSLDLLIYPPGVSLCKFYAVHTIPLCSGHVEGQLELIN